MINTIKRQNLFQYGFFFLITMLWLTPHAFAKEKGDFFIGSSAFTLITQVDETDRNPEFYQSTIGYRFSSNASISFEKISWRYFSPIGIPYGDKKEHPDEEYEGSVRSKGVSITYQHFFGERFFSALHYMPMEQTYLDPDGNKIGEGEQLFLTFRIGYQFGDTFFIEPSLAVTHWPKNTGLPTSFQEKEDKWPNYFLLEPGLNFGINF